MFSLTVLKFAYDAECEESSTILPHCFHSSSDCQQTVDMPHAESASRGNYALDAHAMALPAGPYIISFGSPPVVPVRGRVLSGSRPAESSLLGMPGRRTVPCSVGLGPVCGLPPVLSCST